MSRLKLFWNKIYDTFGAMSRLRGKHINRREISFKNSDSPLTSERVSIILGSQIDSERLAHAVRSLRHHGEAKFKVSKDTSQEIEKAMSLRKAQ